MVGATIELSPTVTIEIEVGSGAQPIDQAKNIIEACSFWQQLPTVCPMPGCAASLIFFARHPQSYHYYGLKCTGPKTHEMNFSERKDGTSFYIKEDAWRDAYGGEGQQSEPASAQGQQQQQSTQTQQAQASPTGEKADQALIVSVMRKAAEKSSNALEFANNVIERKIAKLADMTTKEANSVLSYLEQL